MSLFQSQAEEEPVVTEIWMDQHDSESLCHHIDIKHSGEVQLYPSGVVSNTRFRDYLHLDGLVCSFVEGKIKSIEAFCGKRPIKISADALNSYLDRINQQMQSYERAKKRKEEQEIKYQQMVETAKEELSRVTELSPGTIEFLIHRK